MKNKFYESKTLIYERSIKIENVKINYTIKLMSSNNNFWQKNKKIKSENII